MYGGSASGLLNRLIADPDDEPQDAAGDDYGYAEDMAEAALYRRELEELRKSVPVRLCSVLSHVNP
jgi:hypothetical protein